MLVPTSRRPRLCAGLRVLSPQKSRSRNQSYADLQKLRMSKGGGGLATGLDVHPSQAQDDDAVSPTDSGLHFRASHRDRRSSLTDRVSVERIGAVDRDESFKVGVPLGLYWKFVG